ncbi:alpha/beta hydrolase [Mycobacterium kubicae]|uniref:alpha/beta hydrolase n=1 Tax=Mycobacterium kubicae TaxID=120959 RepID=UPI001640E982|nr:alpha/beta hydrolase [Mycobacterium kubicae]QNI07772.1 alpha/beta hydrolase [Mycobacterium kubicae]
MNDDVPLRGSLRSRAAVAMSTLLLRPITGLIPVERAWGIWASRKLIAGLMRTFGPAMAGSRIDYVDRVLPDGRRVVGEWVYGPNVSPTRNAAVYYVHGSGYAMCSPKTHRRLTSWLSSLTGLPVFCVDYRLAPQHRFPTAAQDVRAGWDWLLHGCELRAKDIVVGGDSAGGHLSVDMLLQPEVAANPPAALVLFSPLIDLTFALCAARELHRPDPAIRAAAAAKLVALYSMGVDPAHRRLKLDVAGGLPLPPTLVQAGGAEMLEGDARQLAADIHAAGGECELQIWPDQLHVFQALPRLSPEASEAMQYAARFIAKALADNVTATEKAG